MLRMGRRAAARYLGNHQPLRVLLACGGPGHVDVHRRDSSPELASNMPLDEAQQQRWVDGPPGSGPRLECRRPFGGPLFARRGRSRMPRPAANTYTVGHAHISGGLTTTISGEVRCLHRNNAT